MRDYNFRFHNSPRHSVIRALDQFTKLSENDATAIYALRNAIAHDFSLASLDSSQDLRDGHLRPGRERIVRVFNVVRSEAAAVVTQPEVNWDGRYPVGSGMVTTVSVRAVADEAEAAVLTAADLHTQHRLDARVPDVEFLNRYFILMA